MIDIEKIDLGRNIQDICAKQGIPIADLAYEAELSRSCLRGIIEMGRDANPHMGTVLCIANALNMTVDELLGIKPTAKNINRENPFARLRNLVEERKEADEMKLLTSGKLTTSEAYDLRKCSTLIINECYKLYEAGLLG